jgi:Lar family restriction alleviation protein
MNMRPCPFCGSNQVTTRAIFREDVRFVECSTCLARGPLMCEDDPTVPEYYKVDGSNDPAVQKWNNRAASSPTPKTSGA